MWKIVVLSFCVSLCWAVDEGCPEIDDPLNPVFFPHEERCDKFYVCSKGKKTLVPCSNGQHWSQSKKSCVAPEESECEIKEPTTEEPTEAPPEFECPAVDVDQKPVFFPSLDRCEDFYWCSHGNGLIFTCPNNLHWSQQKYGCEEPSVVNCTVSSNHI
jgi:hypothetical protein